jgi:hypothetical protein
MKTLLAVSLLLVSASGAFGETLLYRSNSFGMLLEPVQRYGRDQTEWVIEVERKGSLETRRLLDNGAETRRWETAVSAKSGEKTEREFAGDALVALRIYDRSGSLLQEDQYAGGGLSQKTVLTYGGGRLQRVRVQASDGTLLYTEDYLYETNGALRQVRRTPPVGEASLSAYTYGSSGLSEERTTAGDTANLDRYDSRGRVIHRERRASGAIVSIQDFSFRPDSGVLLSSIERYPDEGKQTERSYDEKGLLSEEVTTAAGKVLDTIAYARNDKGWMTTKTRRGPLGLEVWRYSLDDSGKVTREAYSVSGSLARMTLYGDGKLRTEALYKEGEVFLKIFYDGDTRLREEVFVDGVKVQERSY